MKFYNKQGGGDVAFMVYNQSDQVCTFALWESGWLSPGADVVYSPSEGGEFKVRVSWRGEGQMFVCDLPARGNDAWVSVSDGMQVSSGTGGHFRSCHCEGPW